MSNLLKPFGTSHGSFAVWVQGDDGIVRSTAIVAPQNGPRVPSAPAVLLTRKLLTDGPAEHGAFVCVGFISLEEYDEHLRQFGIHLVEGNGRGWSE
jgi:hypothetical protein